MFPNFNEFPSASDLPQRVPLLGGSLNNQDYPYPRRHRLRHESGTGSVTSSGSSSGSGSNSGGNASQR